MRQVRTLFWDVGGVLLSNAWDHQERQRAVEQFHLQKDEFEASHKQVVADFETGKMTLDQYLERTVFYQSRSFTREEFKRYMLSQSRAKQETLDFARALATKCVMSTINNESRELNEYRIRTFELTKIFDLFVSSCYVGLRKPDERIYRLAIDLVQKDPQETCFIDDRPENIEGAQKIGMRTILVQNFPQLKNDLQSLGIES
ncbi:MAG TPA: HAD family phosphatase [Terriglobales bacterium]|nr:HAD family phosphatase [Terriglobales bacterium]